MVYITLLYIIIILLSFLVGLYRGQLDGYIELIREQKQIIRSYDQEDVPDHPNNLDIQNEKRRFYEV